MGYFFHSPGILFSFDPLSERAARFFTKKNTPLLVYHIPYTIYVVSSLDTNKSNKQFQFLDMMMMIPAVGEKGGGIR